MKIEFNELAPSFFEGLGLTNEETEKFLQSTMARPNMPVSTQLAEVLGNPDVDVRLKICAVFVFGRTIQQNLDLQNIHKALNDAFGLAPPPAPQVMEETVH